MSKERNYVTRDEAVAHIREHGSKFTAVIFRKRTDGSIRRMTFRTGVTSHLKGGEMAYNAQAHKLITVFDVAKQDYRSIPIEGIQRLKINGKWMAVIEDALKTKKYPKFKSWRDLYDRCKAGDEKAQRICIGALHNLGNTTLPSKREGQEMALWQRAYHGLQKYISALVCEYGETETKAERDILAEVNNVIDCCDDVKLEE